MRGKEHKIHRALDIYVRLCEGRVISKAEEAARFGVEPRSIQRDIDDIRSFLSERRSSASGEPRDIIYDRSVRGFVMTGNEDSVMNNAEILAVSKILLESRAFTRNEIYGILDKLIQCCAPRSEMKIVQDLIANERFHYVELHHRSCIQDKLWNLGLVIKKQQMLKIEYRRQKDEDCFVSRIVQPVALTFSEYYFYLHAYIVEKDDAGEYRRRHDYPTIFRMDRIHRYCELDEHFRITYSDRFEEGKFRKRIQFMYAGELMKVRFRYTGSSIDAILDRLPTAHIDSSDDEGWIVGAEVYGQGILMWLLSQAEHVEIIEPQCLRDRMKETLEKMLEKYK